jgi:3-hydroxyacyl-CoA dehydrogenase
MISQAMIDERKAEREVINRVRAIRRKIEKEKAGMTPEESTAFVHNRVRKFFLENGYTLTYADGTTIP